MSDFRTKANRVYLIVRLVVLAVILGNSMLSPNSHWTLAGVLYAGLWIAVTIGYIIKGKLPPVIRTRHY